MVILGGVLAAVTGIYFGPLEEGTHAYCKIGKLQQAATEVSSWHPKKVGILPVLMKDK